MNKLTRALVLGLATSAFTIVGCASSCNSAEGDCNSAAKAYDSTQACVDCTDPNCEKCAAAQACVDCGGPTECAKCAAKAATLGAVNEACPFSDKPVRADIDTVSFQGQEIGFCCFGCVEKFDNMTDAERGTLLDM